jgi:ABC-2 type transport system ATP-binding protein
MDDITTQAGLSIEARQLTKRYGAFTAVDRVDLSIKQGEIYGLLGPNGAGKTTVIKMLAGILPPDEGDMNVLGRRVPDLALAARLGYMPQETALYTGLTVHQNLQFYGELFGLRRERLAAREAKMLEFIDLEEWRNALVRKLSGGMQHRVSLACALIHEPKVLFLDEPTVGVDPELRWAFWDFFRQLKSEGVTMLITTHYMDEACRCDRVGFMRHGRLIAEGGPDELMASCEAASLEEAFMRFAEGAS